MISRSRGTMNYENYIYIYMYIYSICGMYLDENPSIFDHNVTPLLETLENRLPPLVARSPSHISLLRRQMGPAEHAVDSILPLLPLLLQPHEHVLGDLDLGLALV